jgi:hypothetical protein
VVFWFFGCFGLILILDFKIQNQIQNPSFFGFRCLAILVDERHKREAIKHRNKITKMILINGTIYSLSHVPVFVITILLIVFKKELADFCFFYISYTELMEMPDSFCLISICLQFFIVIYFDQNFKMSFLEIVRKFKIIMF